MLRWRGVWWARVVWTGARAANNDQQVAKRSLVTIYIRTCYTFYPNSLAGKKCSSPFYYSSDPLKLLWAISRTKVILERDRCVWRHFWGIKIRTIRASDASVTGKDKIFVIFDRWQWRTSWVKFFYFDKKKKKGIRRKILFAALVWRRYYSDLFQEDRTNPNRAEDDGRTKGFSPFK